MSERATTLAERFERAHREFLTTVVELTETEWTLRCPNEARTIAALTRHVAAWKGRRNQAGVKADWQFTTADARTKLRKLYPTVDA